MTSELNIMQDYSFGEFCFVSAVSKVNKNLSLAELKFISKSKSPVSTDYEQDIKIGLSKVNKENVFEFFQNYKNNNGGVFDLMSRCLLNTGTSDFNLNIRNLVMPITYLLKQAEAMGLEKSDAYKGLKQRVRELCALLLRVEHAPDLSEIVLNDFDMATNNLLIIMNKFIH